MERLAPRRSSSIKISDARKGETAVFRNPEAIGKELVATPNPEFTTAAKVIRRNFREYPNKPWLFFQETQDDGKIGGTYVSMNFSQIEKVVKKLGTALLNKGMVPEKKEFRDYCVRFVGIYGRNCPEWVFTMLTTYVYGFASVPIYDSMHESAAEYSLNLTDVEVLFTTVSHLPGIFDHIKSKSYKTIKHIVIMDAHSYLESVQEWSDKFSKETDCKVHTFVSLLESVEDGDELEFPDVKDEDIA